MQRPADPDILLQDDSRQSGPDGDGAEYVALLLGIQRQKVLSHHRFRGLLRAASAVVIQAGISADLSFSNSK